MNTPLTQKRPDADIGGQKEAPPTLSVLLAIRLAWNLGYLIAIPAVIFGFSGAYLDKALGTSPLFLLVGFVIAGLLSAVGVIRKVREVLKEQ